MGKLHEKLYRKLERRKKAAALEIQAANEAITKLDSDLIEDADEGRRITGYGPSKTYSNVRRVIKHERIMYHLISAVESSMDTRFFHIKDESL